MEFGFSAAEQAFAEDVRRFLRDNPLDRFPLDGMDAGYGSGAHSRPFLRALADPERLRRVGAAARRRAGDYDLDLMVKRLAEVHRRVVDAHGGRTEELVHGRLR